MNSLQHHLIVLTAPPATGKTRWILSFAAEYFPKKILVLSPLRALANECRNSFPENVLVMTPEEWMGKKIFTEVLIVDEFHLWFYWGDTFRPLMWEVFYELSQSTLTVLLTATMNEKMKKEIDLMASQFDRMTWYDFGNQRLRYRPKKYVRAPSRNWLLDFIFLEKKGAHTNLIFCAFRQEVVKLGATLEDHGFKVWTCVGGEANALSLKVQSEAPPDFIVCTSVLSHGVNLPTLKRVYLFHEVSNEDFWIQMVARGGRRGESFEVFALEKPVGIKWNQGINLLAIQFLSLKMKLLHTLEQVQSWFLKESSSPECPIKSAT